MRKSILTFLLSGAFLLGLSSFTLISNEGPGDWVRLGSRKVNYKVERDVIQVGLTEGGFKKLKVKVTGGSLNMHKMMVTYGNGSKDNIPLKFNFKQGAESRVIDLNGGKRVIKRITFWYDTKNFNNQRATIHVAGRR